MIIWQTNNDLNKIITNAIAEGMQAAGEEVEVRDVSEYSGEPEPCISYGFLRGVAQIYKDCEEAGVEWWNIDHGFFRFSILDGYYRIGCRHLQPLYLEDSPKNDFRWKSLGLEISPWKNNPDGPILICPPTEATAEFYGIDPTWWIVRTTGRIPEHLRDRTVVREKGSTESLEDALKKAYCVVVFNSNVAMEALLVGVPAIAEEGIVHSWNGLTPEDADGGLQNFDRLTLFRYASWCQFTLEEMKTRLAWKSACRMQRRLEWKT